MALPFDAGTPRSMGAAKPVAQDVGRAGPIGFDAFSASENGVLLYRAGNVAQNRVLVWLDRSGKPIETKSEAQPIDSVALSPDGKQAAISILTSQASGDVWLQDLVRGTQTKFTFGPGFRRWPVWYPDGSYLLFHFLQQRASEFFRKPANSGAGDELLLEAAGDNSIPLDISRDGKFLVYSATGGNTKDDLWLMPLGGEHKPLKYLDGPSEERHAQFSPDGKWMAYSSDESVQFEVYLQSVPTTGAKHQVSNGGGTHPRWRRDGKELYYISADSKLMAVPVSLGAGTVDVGTPQKLFEQSFPWNNSRSFGYAPSADGQKFLMLLAPEGAAATPPVTIWINWMAGLNK
jgi:Tol biopolymer transport system component